MELSTEAMIKKNITFLTNNIYLGFCYACRRLNLPGYKVHQISLPKEGLIYIPIPKNACSSVKHLLYEIEFDQTFNYDGHREWGYRDIHDYYIKRSDAFTGVETLKERTDVVRFALIRDPVKRLISCYRNRVVDLGDLKLSRNKLEQMRLPLEPDINTFVENLEKYQEANKKIEHHSRPQTQFLGGTLEYLDRIFILSEMTNLLDMLREYDPDLGLQQRKTGGTKITLADLSEKALHHALTFYQKDYELLGDYFTPEDIVEKYRALNAMRD